jgi:hypothetical protein
MIVKPLVLRSAKGVSIRNVHRLDQGGTGREVIRKAACRCKKGDSVRIYSAEQCVSDSGWPGRLKFVHKLFDNRRQPVYREMKPAVAATLARELEILSGDMSFFDSSGVLRIANRKRRRVNVVGVLSAFGGDGSQGASEHAGPKPCGSEAARWLPCSENIGSRYAVGKKDRAAAMARNLVTFYASVALIGRPELQYPAILIAV